MQMPEQKMRPTWQSPEASMASPVTSTNPSPRGSHPSAQEAVASAEKSKSESHVDLRTMTSPPSPYFTSKST